MTTAVRDPLGSGCPPEEYRQVMRHHAAGVSVITTYRDGPVGFSATSLSSVSLDPAVVSFSVSRHSASGQAWAHAAHGIVHLLDADQAALALAMAQPGFGSAVTPVRWHFGPHGQPLLDHVAAWLVIRPRTRLPIGPQLLVICDVLRAVGAPGPGPLVHHDGCFHGLRGFAD